MRELNDTEDGKILFRLRSDLRWHSREHYLGRRWVAQDPLTLRFFYMSDAERRVVVLLHKPRTCNAIIQLGEAESGLDAHAIRKLLERCLQTGLLRTERSGHVGGFKSIAGQKMTRHRISRALSFPLKILAFRIPLFDPSGLLQRTRLLGKIVFSYWSILGLVFAWLFLAAIAALNWDRLQAGGLDLFESFGWSGLGWFFAAYLLLKSAHEFGHALACRRFGAECGEVGLYVICLIPCFYCDVTDAWKIPCRWRRAWIDAAGVYCELWIAVVAGLIWFASHPGIVHSLSLNLFIVGSLATILINGNPLLRFDGYYLLSDIFDVPNLASQSSKAISGVVQRVVSSVPTKGTERKADAFILSPRIGFSRALRKWWRVFYCHTLQNDNFDAPVLPLIAYGLLSWIYRIAAIGAILWSIDFAFGKIRMGQVGRILVLLLIVAFIVQFSVNFVREFGRWWRHPFVSRTRIVIFLCVLAGGAWYVCNIPFGIDVQTVGVLTSQHRTPVYVTRSGRLLESIKSGEAVNEQTVIYRLSAESESLSIAKLETRVEEIAVKLEYWNASGEAGVENVAARETLAKSLQSMRNQLDSLNAEASELTRKELVKGRFVAAFLPVPQSSWEHELEVAGIETGRNVRTDDQKLVGGKLSRGTLFGWIVQDGTRYVDAYVDEGDIGRIKVGYRVRMRLAADPGREVSGVIKESMQEPLDGVPVSVKDQFNGASRQAFRLVIAPESDLPNRWVAEIENMRVQLSIASEPASLVRRFRRFVAETVRW